jgi:hypothetical protein
MNPLTDLATNALLLPCGTDCAYATPLMGRAGEWVHCAQPDRDRYVARESRECSCFRPRRPRPATPRAS